MGVCKTLTHLKDKFTWSTIREDTRKFIASCLDCQHTKYETQKPVGLLCPLPVPNRPWENLSMDFIVGLPVYRGHISLLIVVDKFSKGLHLGMLHTHHTAHSIALLFMEIVGKLHGMPKSIVSDRDLLFISKFWQKLFSLSGTKLRMSSTYHPQSDGQTEVANHIVEQYLRAFFHRRPSSWGRFLLWAEWSYNTSSYLATCISAFEITFG